MATTSTAEELVASFVIITPVRIVALTRKLANASRTMVKRSRSLGALPCCPVREIACLSLYRLFLCCRRSIVSMAGGAPVAECCRSDRVSVIEGLTHSAGAIGRASPPPARLLLPAHQPPQFLAEYRQRLL